ncbi:HIT-like protein [Laetiporus sulphureus 93-53]|uniref:HIT-like protein n=1 Tax=Laetiporus sulphureus 93-53 TaxID=1314785 RepID=A0A165GQN9_9APHY|nr:HIT-like protein [Laetiporus sulphureus 93-53]KZT10673.1 HIT-like protein [Laetiporus sulphureus 93-53]
MRQALEIINTLPDSFQRALEAGDVLFFPSTVHRYVEHNVEFEIRLCPALQKKPQLPMLDFSTAVEVQPKKSDPFAPPYVPNLYLGELRDEQEDAEYVILFNKYSIVPHHFLMVTKEYQPQTKPLLPPDLVQVYMLLLAAQRAGRRFFAFYNCGDLSGASQPHKHVQLLPLEDDGPPIERLARATKIDYPDRPFALESLPYANHVRRLPPSLAMGTYDVLERTLADAFLSLLDLTVATVRHDPEYPSGTPSYNFVLTLEHMHVIPRKKENHVLSETGEPLSVNALGFAGCLLVKSERELEAVKGEGVGKILRGVGLESVHDILASEHPDDLGGLHDGEQASP